MFKKMTFTKKLLLSVLSVLLVSSVITTYLISIKSYDSIETAAKENLSNLADKYAFHSKDDLNKTVALSYGFASSLETMLKNKQYTKKSILDLMNLTLKKNPFILGIYGQFDSNVFFQNDLSLAKKDGHDEIGRFAPYVARSKGSFVLSAGTAENKSRPWVDVPRKTRKEYITEPYYFAIDGVDVLMVTIAVPLYDPNGKFIGSVGADISLKEIAENITKIKIFDNGYAFLLSQEGVFISHPKEKLVNTKISDLENYEEAQDVIKSIKDNKIFEYNRTSLNGLTSHYFILPFKIANTGTSFAIALAMPQEEYLETAIALKWFSIIAGIISFIIIAIVIFISTKTLGNNLEKITEGLNSFFKYLNKESSHSDRIDIKSQDEFGQMANMINENINKTQLLIEQDNNLINDVKQVVEKVKGGDLSSNISSNTSNESLEELKVIFNEMLEVMSKNVCNNLNNIQKALEEFQKLNFTHRIKNPYGKTSKGLNALADIINEMLVDNKSNGLTLEDSSNILMSNVDSLTTSSNEAAASLEETAAALEEITSTIVNNTENVSQMSASAQALSNSATQGQKLASDTTVAMDDITEQVTLINEAISVIDQIAFQTNILSLNAAVEAATAGEAGKGFAVVAQEVRNLASRSAEAAKEIKELVENATSKASFGKNISGDMIKGYDELLKNISGVTERISEITSASKEQESGITQINDAITQLDQQTQQNAQVATQTQDIANNTLVIAKTVVQNANDKEFIGKDTVQAKSFTENTSSNTMQKTTANSTRKITANESENNQWESF